MGRGLLQTTERTLTPTPDSETLFLLMAEKLSLLLGSHESILSPVQSEEHLRLSQERGLPQEGVGSRVSKPLSRPFSCHKRSPAHQLNSQPEKVTWETTLLISSLFTTATFNLHLTEHENRKTKSKA